MRLFRMGRQKVWAFFVIGVMMALLAWPVPAGADAGPSHDLAGLITQYVRDNASWGVEDFRIEFPAKLPTVNLKGENISYDVTPFGRATLIGSCNFQVLFFRDGVQVERYQVRVNIEVQESYVVSTRVIERNAIISAADVQTLRRWVRRPSPQVIADAEEIVGKRLTANLVPNQEVKRSMIREPIVIKRGEMVRIVLDNGPMSLMATGVAEEAGVDRQRIRVRNLSSQKVFFAKVVSEGLVKVELF